MLSACVYVLYMFTYVAIHTLHGVGVYCHHSSVDGQFSGWKTVLHRVSGFALVPTHLYEEFLAGPFLGPSIYIY